MLIHTKMIARKILVNKLSSVNIATKTHLPRKDFFYTS